MVAQLRWAAMRANAHGRREGCLKILLSAQPRAVRGLCRDGAGAVSCCRPDSVAAWGCSGAHPTAGVAGHILLLGSSSESRSSSRTHTPARK